MARDAMLEPHNNPFEFYPTIPTNTEEILCVRCEHEYDCKNGKKPHRCEAFISLDKQKKE